MRNPYSLLYWLCHFHGRLENRSSLKRRISRDTPQAHSAFFRDEYRGECVPGTQDKPGYVRYWTERLKSRAVQILLLACPRHLNIHPRLQQLMKTAASKGAFFVDFSIVLQEQLYRGGMAAGLEYPLVEQREQCWVAKSMGAETTPKDSLRPFRWFTSNPFNCR